MAQGDYIKQASALALSIKKTQSSISNISIITDGVVDDITLFDHIIPIPDIDLAINEEWKIHNRVYFYDLTPYDETVILDADMLFLSDVSNWWDMLKKYDLLVTDKVKTYRGDWVTQDFYRKTFVYNGLPNLYSAFTYFKKSDLANDFFALMKEIIINWDEFTCRYSPEYKQEKPSIDVAMGIAALILDCEDMIVSSTPYPTFTHMKGGCQGWNSNYVDWENVLGVYPNNMGIRIGPYMQTGILHYVVKDFVTPEILKIFEKC